MAKVESVEIKGKTYIELNALNKYLEEQGYPKIDYEEGETKKTLWVIRSTKEGTK